MAWPVGCWVFVLTAIAVVQVVRAQWFDAAVFFLASAGVSLDAVFRPRFHPRRSLPPGVLAAAALVAGLVIAALPRHGALMRATVIIAGIAAVAVGWAGWAIRAPQAGVAFSPGVRALALTWAAIMVAGCLWELFQFLMSVAEPSGAWFSLSDLLNPFVGQWVGKAAFTAAWLVCGVWLLRRGGRRAER
ncbi:MAG TPA: hypothetical protein VFQ96_07505 [Microbacteriaceae bacterium]|nr:hypothetical protein [Microbacteriaceae bacterium]